MTQQEATKWFEQMLPTFKEGSQEWEVTTMAIEALQFQDIMVNNPKSAKPTPEVCKNCKDNDRPHEPTSDDLIIKGAKGIKDGLYNIKNGELFRYKTKGGTVRTYPIVEALQDDWIPVSDDTLPEPCTEVQVTCEVRYSDGMKHKYQSIAQWIPKNCEEALGINWDVEATEYNEEKDEYYPLEGWYESIKNWDEFSLVAISDFVVAWRPLPEPYKTDMRGKE